MLTLAFLAAVVLATRLLGTWAGLAVFVLLSAGAIWWIVAGRRAT